MLITNNPPEKHHHLVPNQAAKKMSSLSRFTTIGLLDRTVGSTKGHRGDLIPHNRKYFEYRLARLGMAFALGSNAPKYQLIFVSR